MGLSDPIKEVMCTKVRDIVLYLHSSHLLTFVSVIDETGLVLGPGLGLGLGLARARAKARARASAWARAHIYICH